MQYVIMLGVVLLLAVSDFITGIIKGFVTSTLSSTKMRKGGMNKLAEIVIMAAVCGLEIGINELGKYYGEKASEFTVILGAATAIGTFTYIVLMELLSMLENYAEINPKATWAKKLIKRLKNVQDKEGNEDDQKRN